MNPRDQIAAELYSRLGRFVGYRVSDPSDAEDVLQDVFVKVLGSRGPTEASKLLPWMYAIARNTITDFYRARDRRREHPSADVAEPPNTDDPKNSSPENSSVDLRGALGDLMDLLSEQDQQVLQIVDLEGLSQKQYADRLGLDYTTAKSRVQRARKRLRREFDRCCEIVVDNRGAPIECTPRRSNSCC